MALFRITNGLIMFARRYALLACLTVLVTTVAPAQDGDAKAKKDPFTQEQTQFAPGVVTVIPPAPDPTETFSGPLTLKSLIDAHPEIVWGGTDHPDAAPHYDPRSRTLIEMAKQIILRREIYCFEFAFKPLRQIYIDVPLPNGRMQRKLIWYMVYRVRYRGGDLRPAPEQVGGSPVFKRIEAISYESRRLFPMLVLTNHTTGKEYLDRVLPTAKQKIAIREQITTTLYNTVEISRVKIPLSTDSTSPGVWGIATWEDIDPNLDFFSINVFGLTNAFEQDGEGPDAPYRSKALQLNFYRPGDTMQPTEDLIRFGIPAYKNEAEQAYVLKQYGLGERLDYRWVFR